MRPRSTLQPFSRRRWSRRRRRKRVEKTFLVFLKIRIFFTFCVSFWSPSSGSQLGRRRRSPGGRPGRVPGSRTRLQGSRGPWISCSSRRSASLAIAGFAPGPSGPRWPLLEPSGIQPCPCVRTARRPARCPGWASRRTPGLSSLTRESRLWRERAGTSKVLTLGLFWELSLDLDEQVNQFPRV